MTCRKLYADRENVHDMPRTLFLLGIGVPMDGTTVPGSAKITPTPTARLLLNRESHAKWALGLWMCANNKALSMSRPLDRGAYYAFFEKGK